VVRFLQCGELSAEFTNKLLLKLLIITETFNSRFFGQRSNYATERIATRSAGFAVFKSVHKWPTHISISLTPMALCPGIKRPER